jgi:SAM-dependent methyltransferase
MEQLKIWDHFQNSEKAEGAFVNAEPRYEFIAKQVKSGATTLNIGVGRGGLESMLIKNGVLVSSLDPSEESIDRLRKQYDLGDRAQVGFSQEMPFKNEQFEVVIMSEVLEHLSDEVLQSTVKEVRRVLKPGGIFIGTVPANELLADNYVMCPHCGESFHRWGHVQSFSEFRLEEIMVKNELTVKRIEIRSFPDWRRAGIRNFVKNSIRYLLGRMGSPISSPHIFFVMQL